MDFSLTEDQALIRDTLREFVASEVLPSAGDLDRSSEFPARALAGLAELGMLGMAIPEAYGGAGLDALTSAVAVEELARGSASLAVTVSVSNSVCAGPILRYALRSSGR